MGGCCIIVSASPAQGRRKALVRVWTYHYRAAARKTMGEAEATSGWISLPRILLFLLSAGIFVSLQAGSLGLRQVHHFLLVHERFTYTISSIQGGQKASSFLSNGVITW